MRNLPLSFAILLLSLTVVNSQNIIDILRYGQLQPTGTARTAGVAGSFGSMGGDWGSIMINPAGIGDFHKTELSFGVSINNVNTNTFIFSDSPVDRSQSHSSPNVNHLGIVITNSPSRGKWTTSNFAIGLSQLKNLTEEWSYTGTSVGSITERFTERANGLTIDQFDIFEAGLAWEAWVIDDFNGDQIYTSHIFDEQALVPKEQSIDRTGKLNELNLAWSGNYNRKFNVGFSINVPFVTFDETKIYTEDDREDLLPFYDFLQFTEELNSTAAGFNVKFGTNVRLTKMFRVGVAAHSPTSFRFEDLYQNSIIYNRTIDTIAQYDRLAEGNFRYIMKTPWKFIGSAGAILNFGALKGFVNLDVEYLNYGASKYNLTKFSNNVGDANYETEINGIIENELGRVVNTKIGGELAYKKIRLRLGANGEGSPYKLEDRFSRKSIAAGLGFRGDRFYLDFSASRIIEEDGYTPYVVLDDNRNQLINKDITSTRLIFSLGFKL